LQTLIAMKERSKQNLCVFVLCYLLNSLLGGAKKKHTKWLFVRIRPLVFFAS